MDRLSSDYELILFHIHPSILRKSKFLHALHEFGGPWKELVFEKNENEMFQWLEPKLAAHYYPLQMTFYFCM
tara:strand:+ start:155 stop:370 length:216 start_codon:yes stop_codon:yes gene_type:complete